MVQRTSSAERARLQAKGVSGIQGLTFRGFRGEADLAALVDVVNQARRADGIDLLATLEGARAQLRHPVNCDPARDILLAEVDGGVIGYIRTEWRDIDSQGRAYMHKGAVLPAWRRRGVGTSLLRSGQQRLREVAREHPLGGDRFLQAFVRDTEAGAVAMLRSDGYLPSRYGFTMVRSLEEGIPDLALPPGLEVRPVREHEYRQVFEANEEAFSDHWGYVARTEEDFQRWLGEPSFQPELWQVAWAGEQIAGMVLNYVLHEENAAFDRLRGYTEDICVRRPWRRRGLASALIARSLASLRVEGMQQAALGVDTQNTSGALRLYESLGYVAVEKAILFRKPLGEE